MSQDDNTPNDQPEPTPEPTPEQPTPTGAGTHIEVTWNVGLDENQHPRQELSDAAKKVSPVSVSILPTAAGYAYEQLSTFEENEVEGNKDDIERWTDSVTSALVSSHPTQEYDDVTQRDEADWQNKATYEGVSLGISRPKIGDGHASRLTGRRAMERITASLSSGQNVSVPLWHSGIWVTLRAPTLSKRIALDNRISRDREQAGRKTRGLAFSNDSVYLHDALIAALMTDIIDSTLEGYNESNLLEVIKLPDLQLLALAYASTIYRDGYPMEQPCMADLSECSHVAKATLSLPKLFRVDNTRLAQSQLAHMASRTKKITTSMLESYHNSWPHLSKVNTVSIEDVRIVLHMPSLDQHLDTGRKWIDEIESMAEQALGRELSDGERAQYVDRQTALAKLQNYRHWIKRIVYVQDDEEAVIDDDESISTLLERISDNVDVTQSIVKGIRTFIKECVVSLPAIPNYQCPSCGNWQNTEKPMEYLIPLDMVSLGFQMQQLNLSTLENSQAL